MDNIKPKYKLGEIIKFECFGMLLDVKITRRILKMNFDTNDWIILYSFIHVIDKKDPWDWEEVDERDLSMFN